MVRRVAFEHHYPTGIRTEIDDGYRIPAGRAGSLRHARHYIKGVTPGLAEGVRLLPQWMIRSAEVPLHHTQGPRRLRHRRDVVAQHV
jgi:hypothetical protein